eukprot:1422987-Pleurochrysis_carterae.AAC.3
MPHQGTVEPGTRSKAGVTEIVFGVALQSGHVSDCEQHRSVHSAQNWWPQPATHRTGWAI